MIAELAPADLERILHVSLDELRPTTREEAESYLAWAFEDTAHDRMTELLEKNSAGTITIEETAELDRHRCLSRRMSILQSRSRVLLRETNS